MEPEEDLFFDEPDLDDLDPEDDAMEPPEDFLLELLFSLLSDRELLPSKPSFLELLEDRPSEDLDLDFDWNGFRGMCKGIISIYLKVQCGMDL